MAKAAKMDKGQQKETLVKVLKYMKPYRFWLIAAIIMAAVYVISSDSYRRCGGCSVTFSSVIPGDG